MNPVYVLLALLFLVACGGASRHHHVDGDSGDVDGGGGGDPDELLPPVCANGETMTRSAHQADLDSFKTCPYQRADVLQAFHKGFDINQNGRIEFDECEKARKYYLTWYERAVAEPCETVFRHCDCDGDGGITPEDFLNAQFTCLRNCDTIVMANHFIVSRMRGNAFEGKTDGV